MEWLSILLAAALAMCMYKIWSANNKKSANEQKFVEDHEARTEKKYGEQMRAAQDESDRKTRVIGSLRHENSTLAAAVNRRGREQREIERQRREIDDLNDKLSDATYDRSTVETASIVKEQWTSISDTLAEAGFVAKTPKELARSIERLLELRNSAEASYNQAGLDKNELAIEKAAKEAALLEVTDLKTKTRILEINIENLEAAAEEHLPSQQSSAISSAEIQANVQLEVDQRMAKERDEMIEYLQGQYSKEKAQLTKDLQGQYNKEKEQLITELQGQFYQEVATEVNSQLNNHRRNELDNEAAARAATEIESFKNHATKLQEQLEQANETATVAEGKLRDAENTVSQKDREYTAWYQSAQTTISEKDDQIKALGEQITHMQNTAMTQAMTSAESKTTSGKLERELAEAHSRISQAENALSAANKETERMRAECQNILDEAKKLQTKHDKLASDLDAAGKQLQTQREQFGGNLATGDQQLQQLQMQIQKLESDLDTAGSTAKMHKEEAQNLKSQLRAANDEIERVKVRAKKERDQLQASVDDLRNQISQGPHSNTAAGQQGGANTQINIPAPPKPQYSDELKELGRAFEGLVRGVNPVELRKIVTHNCAAYRDAASDAQIDFEKVPVHVKFHLFAYMYKNKVDDAIESDETVKRPEDRNIKILKRKNQDGGFPTQQQHGTPAPPTSSTFGAQPPNIQQGGFQPQQQHSTPAPPTSSIFGAQPSIVQQGGFQSLQLGTPVTATSFNFGAQSSNGQQGGFQSQQHGTSATATPFNFGAQSSSSQQQNGTPAPSGSISFGAPRNSGPASASSFNFTASQNITPGPSNSFALPPSTFKGPSSNPFGAPTPSSQPGAKAQNLKRS